MKMRAVHGKRRFASIEVPADMLAVLKLAERSLDLVGHVTQRKEALFVVKRILQSACSAAWSAQYSAFARVEEGRKCREELQNLKMQLEVALVAANKSCIVSKAAKEKVQILKYNIFN